MNDYKFQFERHQITKIPREKILEELERVAEIFNYNEFTGEGDFSKLGRINRTTVINEFGTWKKAIVELKLRLKEKGIDLLPISKNILSDKELFDEMERIWRKIGHRPSKLEWALSDPKINYQTYRRRFGGWVNACMKFIEYKMGNIILSDNVFNTEENINENINNEYIKYSPDNIRTISLKTRLDVLNRDKFRCVFCGRSPATDVGVQLQIDHIEPFSKAGKTVSENLQTLCKECNFGKGDRQIST